MTIMNVAGRTVCWIRVNLVLRSDRGATIILMYDFGESLFFVIAVLLYCIVRSVRGMLVSYVFLIKKILGLSQSPNSFRQILSF